MGLVTIGASNLFAKAGESGSRITEDLYFTKVDASTEIKVGSSTIIKTDRITLNATAGDVGTPAAGDLWYNASTGKLKYYHGSTVYELVDSTSAGIPNPGTKVTNDLLQYNGSSWDAKGAASGDRLGGTLYGSAVDLAGNLTFTADNTYDIGASGATRPRTIYAGTKVNLNPGAGGFTGGGDIWCQTAINASNIWFYDGAALVPTAKRLMWSGEGAGGDLSGTYPSPTVAQIQGKGMDATAPSKGDDWQYNGTSWVHSKSNERVLAVGSVSVSSAVWSTVASYTPIANEFSANSVIRMYVVVYNPTGGTSIDIRVTYNGVQVFSITSTAHPNHHEYFLCEEPGRNSYISYLYRHSGGSSYNDFNQGTANFITGTSPWAVQAQRGGGTGTATIRAWIMSTHKE